MLFNSVHFAIFFVVVTTIFYILSYKDRWKLLLISSCYFYMVFAPVYILILGFTIVVDYYAGIYIERSDGNRRKTYLVTSLLTNIGVLAFFKYYNFINGNLILLLNTTSIESSLPELTMLLPIGLSFHTFQAMSYTIEVYRGKQIAERKFGIYSLYVMFYPQLVAGPIERPQNILHQFKEKHDIDYQQIANGLKLMTWGLFKKVVIADRLAVIVNFVYNEPTQFQGLPLIVATVMFALQIYCDFSGYSDIAIGSAQVMGFRLMKNFDRPYFSKSISEFWKRWHISLSTWFRDYVYIPLGGNRVSVGRWYSNLFITFMLSGLWHGANWTYIVWGGLNGFYLIVESLTSKSRIAVAESIGLIRFPLVHKATGGIITFGLICLSWVFFRANSVNDAMYIIANMFSNIRLSYQDVISTNLGSTKYDVVVGTIALIILFGVEWMQRHQSIFALIAPRPTYQRLTIYFMLIMFIVMFGIFNVQQQFIYFQF